MENLKNQSIGVELTDEELMEMTGGWSFLSFFDAIGDFFNGTRFESVTEPLYGISPTPTSTNTPMPLYGISPTPTPMPLYGVFSPTPTKNTSTVVWHTPTKP